MLDTLKGYTFCCEGVRDPELLPNPNSIKPGGGPSFVT